MELLTIGIDAGDLKILEKMPMPFFKKLLKKMTNIEIEEDLWSRGWSNILSGVPGNQSGAFYEKPLLKKSYEFIQTYNSKSYYENPNIIPLWKLLSDNNISIGFMNIPTTTPVEKVNGFIVGGAGGGSSINGKTSFPDEIFYPKTVKRILEKNNYILDTRFSTSKCQNLSEWFDKLKVMQQNRTSTYIELNKKFNVDFGFITYRSITVHQYLAMKDINSIIENSNNVNYNEHQKMILNLYNDFDNCLEKLVNSINPKKIIITSDHGSIEKLNTINVNAFLKNNNFQFPEKRNNRYTIKKNINKMKKFIPPILKNIVKKSKPSLINKIKISKDIDYTKSVAFGARYVPGIYLNDKKRFDGIVQNENEKEKIVNNIIKTFNESREAIKYKLIAKKYKFKNKKCYFNDLLPEIYIEHPDSIFFEETGDFINKNKNYINITSVKGITNDQFTGIKRRFPLCIIDNQLNNNIKKEDEMDLTLIYKIIKRQFNI